MCKVVEKQVKLVEKLLTVAVAVGAIYYGKLHQLALLQLVLAVHLCVSVESCRVSETQLQGYRWLSGLVMSLLSGEMESGGRDKRLTIGMSSCFTSSRARFSLMWALF